MMGPIKSRPTVEELDKILNDPNPPNVVVNPDGSCSAIKNCEIGPARETGIAALKRKAESIRVMAMQQLCKAAQIDALVRQIEEMNAFALATNAAAGEGDGPAPSIGFGSDAEQALWNLAFGFDENR